MNESSLAANDILRNLQAQILVDRLEWISGEVLQNKACPRCDAEKIDSGPERITSAFIDFISSQKLCPTTFLIRQAAGNIKNEIAKSLASGTSPMMEKRLKRNKAPNFIVFVD